MFLNSIEPSNTRLSHFRKAIIVLIILCWTRWIVGLFWGQIAPCSHCKPCNTVMKLHSPFSIMLLYVLDCWRYRLNNNIMNSGPRAKVPDCMNYARVCRGLWLHFCLSRSLTMMMLAGSFRRWRWVARKGTSAVLKYLVISGVFNGIIARTNACVK